MSEKENKNYNDIMADYYASELELAHYRGASKEETKFLYDQYSFHKYYVHMYTAFPLLLYFMAEFMGSPWREIIQTAVTVYYSIAILMLCLVWEILRLVFPHMESAQPLISMILDMYGNIFHMIFS